MYIENIIILNYRSCKILNLELSNDSPNVFIGLNDSGKSTVLQALDLLLGTKPKFSSYGEGSNKSDISNSLVSIEKLNQILENKDLPLFDFGNDSTLIIGKLIYDEKELEIYNDLNLSSALKWSLESNINNTLWVAKRYHNNKSQMYLLSLENENPLELWNANQTDLNKRIKEFNVSRNFCEDGN